MATGYFSVFMKNKKMFSGFIFTIAVIVSLSGCEKSGKSNPLMDNSVKKYAQAVTLVGSVSGSEGPVTAGKIVAAGENGSIIANAELQSGGRYSIVVPAGTTLPIVLKVDVDAAPAGSAKEILMAVAVDPALKRYEINPLSTAIAAKAKALGGYTTEHMMEAAMSSVAAPDANKTTGGFRGDPTKQYGGWH